MIVIGSDGFTRRLGRDGKWRKLPTRKPIPQDEMPTEAECDADAQAVIYDQACLLLDHMTEQTRRRFFAHLKKKYREY